MKEPKLIIAAPTDIRKALLFSGLSDISPTRATPFNTADPVMHIIKNIKDNITPKAIDSITPVISPAPI